MLSSSPLAPYTAIWTPIRDKASVQKQLVTTRHVAMTSKTPRECLLHVIVSPM
jgi:hypothetical protein